MSGHSKWSTIRRKKGAADAKRGQTFTKYVNAIAIAARDGGDPATNLKLRLAIDKARSVNMPNANINKAIARGSGGSVASKLSEAIYEGYGPGGVAIIVQTATDNRNRTYADVRTAFNKHGGSLAETGAVTYLFDQMGILQLESEDLEAASLAAIDAGAQDVEIDDSSLTIYTESTKLKNVQQQLQNSGFVIASAELGFVPKQSLPIKEPNQANKILKLMAALEDLDDVTATYANFDIPSELMERV